MTEPTNAPTDPTLSAQDRLLESLAGAAVAFDAARSQHQRLWAMHEYLDVVLGLLRLFPVTPPMLSPHNALSQALATQAIGAPHPLLEKVKLDSRPPDSPARLVEHVAAVLASQILRRGGMSWGSADRAAAKLVSDLGVEGSTNSRLSAKTLTQWRSDAGKGGKTAEVGILCASYLAELPEQLRLEDAEKFAKAYASSFLATRYTPEISLEG